MTIITPRGNTTTETAKFIGNDKEITVDTDRHTLVVHDGVTQGGFPQGLTDRGDPITYDVTTTGFTTGLTWRTLDLSTIVPNGTKTIKANVTVNANASQQYIQFRKYGNTNTMNSSTVVTNTSGIFNVQDIEIFCSTDRKIEYRTTTGVFTEISFAIKGWTI